MSRTKLAMIDPILVEIYSVVIQAVMIVILGIITGWYAYSTHKLAKLTENNIQRMDLDQAILFAKEKLLKLYSPILHNRVVIENMPISRVERDKYQQERDFIMRIAENLFLSTDDFSKKWKAFIDSLSLKGNREKEETYIDAKKAMYDSCQKEYDKWENFLGRTFINRFSES